MVNGWETVKRLVRSDLIPALAGAFQVGKFSTSFFTDNENHLHTG
jgi:hypothetical protein